MLMQVCVGMLKMENTRLWRREKDEGRFLVVAGVPVGGSSDSRRDGYHGEGGRVLE